MHDLIEQYIDVIAMVTLELTFSLIILCQENIDQLCQTSFPSQERRSLNNLYIKECKIKIQSVVDFTF